jgi:hypothetical protein
MRQIRNDNCMASRGSEGRNYGVSASSKRDGTFFLADLDRIATAGAVQAIPDLRKQFKLADDTRKGPIARALVKLGVRDDAYWGYLLQRATAAVQSDAPSPSIIDSAGAIQQGLAPEFVSLAKSHTLSIDCARGSWVGAASG